MKELTKKSLEDLAKKLPVVSEADQNQMIGGSVYVNPYGVRYGRAGYNDTLYVLGSDAVYNQILNKDISERDNQGISLYDATPERFSGTLSAYEGIEIQKNVFQAYARNEISYMGAVKVTNDYYQEDIFYDLDSNALVFNVADSGMIFSEQGLIQELRRVRKTIVGSGSLPGDSGSIPEEEDIETQIQNIMDQVEDLDDLERKAYNPYNQGLINEYQNIRRTLARELYSLWRAQGRAGMGSEIWDAERECGVGKVYG